MDKIFYSGSKQQTYYWMERKQKRSSHNSKACSYSLPLPGFCFQNKKHVPRLKEGAEFAIPDLPAGRSNVGDYS